MPPYYRKELMNSPYFSLFALICFLLFSSCEKKEFLIVDSELQPFFEKFQEEAAIRGREIDLKDLRIEGVVQQMEGVGGNCQHNSVDPDLVSINTVFWIQADYIEKEFLVFHELGHCALKRSHLDTKGSDGFCKSIMHSGTAGCGNNYNEDTREKYLDELF